MTIKANYRVTLNYILDGDTLDVTDILGKQYKTRARWIDAPETQKLNEIAMSSQETNQWLWGETSHSYLKQILQGKLLFIIPFELDKYGRVLADWYIDKIKISNNVQIKMMAAGMAVDYLPLERYNLTQKDLSIYIGILRNQYQARKNLLGIWNDPNFQIPSEWRKNKFN